MRRKTQTSSSAPTHSNWEESIIPTPSVSQDDNVNDAVSAPTYRPGYLGPTSYDAILPKDDEAGLARDRYASVETEDYSEEFSLQHPLTKAMRTHMATEVLRSLRHYRMLDILIKGYWMNCQAGVVPAPLSLGALEGLKETVDKHDLTNSPPPPELVAKVLENSAKSLDIPSSMNVQDFPKCCTGDNLRFETIGYLLATAGRSWLFGLANESFIGIQRSVKNQFVDEMLKSSTTTLVLCTLLSPVNDVLIWTFYENLLLTSMMCGYAGPPSWRRLGELSTQIFALGAHRESPTSRLPFFILETRRKLFGAAYNVDKIVSTFLGRPLRISKRHTDIKLPLDLSDEELCSPNPEDLSRAIASLDSNGWNTSQRYLRASWIRLRYTSAQFREEILDFALSKLDACVEQQLLSISHRIKESWTSLPPHFRYWPGCWDENLPSSVCLMLVVVYLTHFYNEFMIQKLLHHDVLSTFPPSTTTTTTSSSSSSTATGPSTPLPLLTVSLTLLSTTLTLANIRDRAYDIHRDFLHSLLVFGVPSASVLATSLQHHHRTSQPFPRGISRAEVIRTLSVLISHLESASEGHFEGKGGGRRGDGNFELCRRAGRRFRGVLDGVLEGGGVTVSVSNDGVGSGGGGGGGGDGETGKETATGTGLVDDAAVPVVNGVMGSQPGDAGLEENSPNLDLNFGLDMFGAPLGVDGFEGMDFMIGGEGLYDGVGLDIDWGAVGEWSL